MLLDEVGRQDVPVPLQINVPFFLHPKFFLFSVFLSLCLEARSRMLVGEVYIVGVQSISACSYRIINH